MLNKYNVYGIFAVYWSFKVDGKTKRTAKKDREERLLEVIRTITSQQSEFLIQYMFYDVALQRNVIWDDVSFTEMDLENCCLPPIF